MLRGRDIVLISSIDWSPLWQSHQEIATRFAAAGNRVLFVENTGVRAPRLGDAGRIVTRLRNWRRSARRDAPPEIAEDVHVLSPLVLPPFGPRAARAVNRRVLLRAVVRAARRLGMREPIVWTWLPTDTALDLAALLAAPGGFLVYHCIADFEELTTKPERLRATERELLGRTDLVLAHSVATQERCAPFARRVELLPPSVDVEKFALADAPARDAGAPPVIGYVGGVHAIVDLELVAECARRRPDWRWVFVGPLQRSVAPVAGLDNVEMLGPRPHDALPAIVASFDVGMVPYVNLPETRTVAPTKINEYLAVGRPVVSTDLPWVVDYQAASGVVEVARPTPEDFIAATERALTSAVDPDEQQRRRAAAARFDWATRLEWVSGLIEEASS